VTERAYNYMKVGTALLLLVIVIVCAFPTNGVLVYVSQDDVSNVFLRLLNPYMRPIHVNVADEENIANNINYIISEYAYERPLKKIVVADYSSDALVNRSMSIVSALRMYGFQKMTIFSLQGYIILQSLLIVIFAGLVIRYFSENKIRMLVYLSLLPVVIIPTRYFPLLFTSLFVIVSLGSRVYGAQRLRGLRRELLKLSSDPLDYIIFGLSVGALVLILRLGVYPLTLVAGLAGALTLFVILMIFSIPNAWINISLLGVIGTIISILMKSNLVEYYYGADFGVRMLMLTFGMWAMERNRNVPGVLAGLVLFIIGYI